jgi:hypothetical protein
MGVGVGYRLREHVERLGKRNDILRSVRNALGYY